MTLCACQLVLHRKYTTFQSKSIMNKGYSYNKLNNSFKCLQNILSLVLKESENPQLSFDTSFVCIHVIIATQNAKMWNIVKIFVSRVGSDYV